MDKLLDISWTLHHTSTNSASYRNLFSPSTNQAHLARYFDRLSSFLSSKKPQYVDDLNNESEKLGTFQECTYTIATPPSTSTTTPPIQHHIHIHLKLIYQHTTFTFVLYTPHLILSKASSTHTKHVTTFLCDTFHIAITALKLPSSLLSHTLQDYTTALTRAFDSSDSDSEHRAALLRSTLGTLKLTVSFSAPVAPHLKTVDLSVPYEAVDALLPSTSDVAGRSFVQDLARHVHLHTGLRLPLSASDGGEEGEGSDDGPGQNRATSVVSTSSSSLTGPPLRLSKVACSAFVIGVEGRLRFAAKALENAGAYEDVVVAANIGLLGAIIDETKKRGGVE